MEQSKAKIGNFHSRLLYHLNSSKPGLFLLSLASTHLSDIPNLSAAGANSLACRLTPSIDSEYLMGQANHLPVSPDGITSPVFITKALLKKINLDVKIVDCGVFQTPQIDHIKTGAIPAFTDTSQALSLDMVENLYAKGLSLGKIINSQYDYVVLAECVPGGTTTACGIFYLSGIDAFNLVSSSVVKGNHRLKEQVIKEKIGYAKNMANLSAFEKISLIGDGMQAFSLGVLNSLKNKLVILAGGTQMLAVWELLKDIGFTKNDLNLDCFRIFTTKWVASDNNGGFHKLANLVSANCEVSDFDFHESIYPGLKAYESGHIKEGVGLGAMLKLAQYAGLSHAQILQLIEKEYASLKLEGKNVK